MGTGRDKAATTLDLPPQSDSSRRTLTEQLYSRVSVPATCQPSQPHPHTLVAEDMDGGRMSMGDLPPLYTSLCLTHVNTLPPYTESPTGTESVLYPTLSAPSGSNRSLTRRYAYMTDHLEIDLGEFPIALMHPAYGFNGVVEGQVKFRNSCTRVLQLTVKVCSDYSWTFLSD